MANNKSAKKRIKINNRNKLQNRHYKTSVRNLTRKFIKTCESASIKNAESDTKELKTLLNAIYSILDKGTKRKVFHKNTAARQKTRLASRLRKC